MWSYVGCRGIATAKINKTNKIIAPFNGIGKTLWISRHGKCHCAHWKTSESMNDTLESNYQILAKLDANTHIFFPEVNRKCSLYCWKFGTRFLGISNLCFVYFRFCLHILWVNARISPFWINEIGYDLFAVQSWIVNQFVDDSDTKLRADKALDFRIAYKYWDESIDVGVFCKSSVAALGRTQRARLNITKVRKIFSLSLSFRILWIIYIFFFYFDKNLIVFQ